MPNLSLCTLWPSCLVVAGLAAAATGQCSLGWQPGQPVPGPAGVVRALVELQNGDLVAGGTFAVADASRVDGITVWNGSTWQPIGPGADGSVHALAVLANGDLVVGGSFQQIGGIAAASIAHRGPNGWKAIGQGLAPNVVITALLALPNGDLVAGGITPQAGGSAPFVSYWDGGTWLPLVGGQSLPTVGFISNLTRLANGDFVVLGSMAMRWNGSAWNTIALAGSAGDHVFAAIELPNGDLVFATDSGVLRYDGVTTVTIGAASAGVFALASTPTGRIVAAGPFAFIGGQACTRIAEWDGVTWSPLGGGRPDSVNTLLVRGNGRLVAAGGRSGSLSLSYAVGEWDAGWTDLGAPKPELLGGQIACYRTLPNGDLLAAGSFEHIGASGARRVARWDGSAWRPLGSGFDDGRVAAAAIAPGGDIVVVGTFTAAGGVAMPGAARWNGAAWSPVGNGLPAVPGSVAVGDDGTIFVAYATGGVSMWSGTAWTSIGSFGLAIQLAIHEGLLVAGGAFSGSSVQRWNGTWTPMGAVTGAVAAVLVTRGGELVIGKSGVNAVQRWDGSAWQVLPGIQDATSLAEFANGDLIAAGTNFGPDSAARWDGQNWLPLGDGNQAVVRVGASGHSDLFLSGSLLQAGRHAAAYLARAAARCPASAQPLGAGCVGSAGVVSLTAATGPWIGKVFRAEAAGLPVPAVSLHVLGAALPPAPLPLATPGCTWFIDPVLVQPLLAVAGAAVITQSIPLAPILIGNTVRSQVLVVEFGAAGGWSHTAASQGLELQFGAL